MKIRFGFVSNSSSSSFSLSKEGLTWKQIDQIINHQKECSKYAMHCPDDEVWDIEDHGEVITGDTWMDNFSMHDFFEHIGIDASKVTWDY